MEKLKTLSGYVLGIAIFVAILFLIGAFFAGAAWISDHLFPWFAKASLRGGHDSLLNSVASFPCGGRRVG